MGYDTNRTNVSLSNIGVRAPNTAPSTGSIIYVPAAGGGWDELVISVPAANVRNALGIDNAETAPSWKTTLDSTNPANISGSAAAPGTSLIYSHRDHVHLAAAGLFAPADADYLVGTANANLSAEIVVGTAPGGELGGTWASPTVDATHSGSAHHAAVTLAADADTVLSLSTQELGLDTQTANTIFSGPTSGGAADPTFRAMVNADLVSHTSDKHTDRTHEIPMLLSGTTIVDGMPAFNDEDAAPRVQLMFAVPTNWVASSNFTVKCLLSSTATGNVDLEHGASKIALDTDDAAGSNLITFWTDSNFSLATANTHDTVTITITGSSVSAGDIVKITFRRNTGDANTGVVTFVAVRVTTTLDY